MKRKMSPSNKYVVNYRTAVAAFEGWNGKCTHAVTAPGVGRCQMLGWSLHSSPGRYWQQLLSKGEAARCADIHIRWLKFHQDFCATHFLAWRSENDFKAFLQYLIYKRQQKCRRGDALSNASLNSVTKVMLSFVVFPDWPLSSKSQKYTIEGKTKGKYYSRNSFSGKDMLSW